MKKEKYITYLPKKQISILRKLADQKGMSISAIIGMSLDRFLMSIDWLEEPFFPQLDLDSLKPKDKENIPKKVRHG